MKISSALRISLILSFALLLLACGGGGSSSSNDSTPDETVINGRA